MHAAPEPTLLVLTALLQGQYAEPGVTFGVAHRKHVIDRSKSILHTEGQLALSDAHGYHLLRQSAGIQLLQSAGLDILDKEATERRSEADSRSLDLGAPPAHAHNAKCNDPLFLPESPVVFLKAS